MAKHQAAGADEGSRGGWVTGKGQKEAEGRSLLIKLEA